MISLSFLIIIQVGSAPLARSSRGYASLVAFGEIIILDTRAQNRSGGEQLSKRGIEFYNRDAPADVDSGRY